MSKALLINRPDQNTLQLQASNKNNNDLTMRIQRLQGHQQIYDDIYNRNYPTILQPLHHSAHNCASVLQDVSVVSAVRLWRKQ